MFLKNKGIGWGLIFLILINLLVDGFLFWWISTPIETECDVTETNRIYHEVLQNRDSLEELDAQSFSYPFCVVDEKAQVLYQSGEVDARTVEDTIREGYAYYNLTGQELLIINTEPKEHILQQRRSMAKVFAILFFVISVTGSVYGGYLYFNIVQPFSKLKGFAACVAAGNLDVPLEMDRKRVFGLFTESFDILREELRLAKQREYEANTSKKELVASLSHDIKTPVTSIKLMCEVLMVKYKDSEFSEKIHSIYHKTEQIDALVTNMFHATLEELDELKVNCRPVNSGQLQQMVEDADFRQKVEKRPDIPDCLIYVDSLRIQQVIGNVVNNSYKYADTRLEVTFCYEQNYLCMCIKDFGLGVSEEDLPHIFQKYYRGRNAKEKEKLGAGLGLSICKDFMERMHGAITAVNESDGFTIKIYMLLA